MQGYADGSGKLTGANDAVYRTGDVASLDEDGYLTFVGRADDVFKSSDYRISPFELESVLIEHESVAEAAIVPRPMKFASASQRPISCWSPRQRPAARPRSRS